MQDADVQPSLIIVYFGGNDSIHPHPSGLGPHVPLQEYIENMRKIITHLKVQFHLLSYVKVMNHIFKYGLDKTWFSLFDIFIPTKFD